MQQQSNYSGYHNNIKKHYVINSEQIMVRKTYTSELRRGPDPAPGRPGEGPREPGRTCARAVFCLENSMSAHKKCSNFFLRQDFCLNFFLLESCGPVASISSKNKRFRSSLLSATMYRFLSRKVNLMQKKSKNSKCSNFFVWKSYALRFSESDCLLLIHSFPGSFGVRDHSRRGYPPPLLT